MPRKKEPKLTNSIRELRAAAPGMTQQDLADRVGVTRQTIIALEGAHTPPRWPWPCGSPRSSARKPRTCFGSKNSRCPASTGRRWWRREPSYFFLPDFLPAFFFVEAFFGAAVLVTVAALPPAFLPNALSQPAEYLSVAPTRTIVTVVYLSTNQIHWKRWR